MIWKQGYDYSIVVENRDIPTISYNQMGENMQYYMEYCQSNPYITPKEWLETKKHF